MLHQIESRILSSLSARMGAGKLAEASGVPLSSILSFSQSLKEKGLVTIETSEESRISPTPEGSRFLAEGFPEERVLRKAASGASIASLSQEEKTVGLAWAARNGWVKVEGGDLTALVSPSAGYPLSESLRAVSEGRRADESAFAPLIKRKLISQSTAKTIYLSPTSLAAGALSGASQQGDGEVTNAISRELLLSGKWKTSRLREYEVSAPVDIPDPAKRHMIARLRRKIARIFSDMGFGEMEGPEIQSSFWNFDALFQPQDHPARDLADTFYLKGSSPLPGDTALVSRVKKVHEKCWGGDWREENAQKPILRTHTTAVSAQYLYNECQDKEPKKYFSIGKVYRNEATDYKHLAEFFQVEGIVVWEGATFRDLLGCLKEFYGKLGFGKIRFQPSYFPYTEPSLEISVFFEKKQQWLELGGAGIFRPEVSIPLCDRYPVLAWGLSLERPLMLLHDMEDIRDFYRSNVGWLRKQKIG